MQNKLHRLKQQMFVDLNSSKNLKQEITQPNLQQFQQELSGRNSMRQQNKNPKQEITQPNLQQFQQELNGRNSMRQQEKNLKHEITQPNLQQFQQEFSGRNSCLCSCFRSATSVHSIALFELHYNCNELQTRYYSSLSLSLSLSLSFSLSLSLSASPSLFLSLFLLLIDLRPQRIKSHSLKMPLSCTATGVFMPSTRIIDAPVDHHPHT